MQSTIQVYDTHECQRKRILELIKIRGYCYTMELVDLHIYQYNARIKELRREGFDIESKKVNGKFAFVLNTYFVGNT